MITVTHLHVHEKELMKLHVNWESTQAVVV